MKRITLFVFALLLISMVTYSQEYSPDSSTVLLLHMNEIEGAIVYDSSYNANNGTATGTSIVTGIYQNARQFDNADYISVPHHSSLDFSSNKTFTVDFWLKILDYSVQYLVGKWGPGEDEDDEWHFFLWSDYKIYFHVNSSTSLHSPDTDVSTDIIPLDTWVHIIGLWNGNTQIQEIYVDGILQESITNSVSTIPSISSQDLRIGYSGGWETDYNFIIDEVRISNRIKNGLVAYYPFNGNANDESGNNLNGSPSSGVSFVIDRFGTSSKAVHFGTTTACIDIADNDLLDLQNDFTLSVWFKGSDFSTSPMLLTKHQANQDIGTWALMANAWLTPRLNNWISYGVCNFLSGNNTFTLNSWQHIIFSFRKSDNNWSFYVNGTLDTQGIAPIVINNTNLGLRIGNEISPVGPSFQGDIDDIRIYNCALSAEQVENLFGNYRQRILSVFDIPNDQGGKVRITWDKIYLDTAGANPQITSYGVWRKIPIGMSVTKHMLSPMAINNDTLGVLYDYLGTVNATQSPEYNFVAQTLADSPSTETYLITAHTSDPNIYYLSDPETGYSVDNIAPSQIVGIFVSVQSGRIELTWDPTMDHDFERYVIYCSTSPNFTPGPETEKGSTTSATYTDNDVDEGYRYYYIIEAVDCHNNHSLSSDEKIVGIPISMAIEITSDKWNIMSLPLEVDDPHKDMLFPNATSDAFAYEGVYVSKDILDDGVGYWLKSPTEVISGYIIKTKEINVTEGWNMIGSISEPIKTTSIVSDTVGIITSDFFEFQGTYVKTDSIRSGKGYWVKVNRAGTLTLSTDTIYKNANAFIKIVPISELPPAPPDGYGIISANQTVPNEFVVFSNYPNPFNPSTSIKYGLPEASHVHLSVYNTLGQCVATLVDEKKDAGFHEVVFSPNGGDAFELPSGIYFYRLQAGNFTSVQKMLLVK